MFKWRRRRPKGTREDRDLEEAARVLEEAEFRSFLDGPGRAPGVSGGDDGGGPDRGGPPNPTVMGPDVSASDGSD